MFMNLRKNMRQNGITEWDKSKLNNATKWIVKCNGTPFRTFCVFAIPVK